MDSWEVEYEKRKVFLDKYKELGNKEVGLLDGDFLSSFPQVFKITSTSFAYDVGDVVQINGAFYKDEFIPLREIHTKTSLIFSEKGWTSEKTEEASNIRQQLAQNWVNEFFKPKFMKDDKERYFRNNFKCRSEDDDDDEKESIFTVPRVVESGDRISVQGWVAEPVGDHPGRTFEKIDFSFNLNGEYLSSSTLGSFKTPF